MIITITTTKIKKTEQKHNTHIWNQVPYADNNNEFAPFLNV